MSHYKYSHKEIDCEYNSVSYFVVKIVFLFRSIHKSPSSYSNNKFISTFYVILLVLIILDNGCISSSTSI